MDVPHPPTMPITGKITFPSSALITAALDFTQQHSAPWAYNHVLRSACFALILSRKIPALQAIDPEIVALSSIMHDLGWDPTEALVSPDKRFEVDGANAARRFLVKESPGWDKYRVQLVWDAIALHTTPSISMHKEAEVAATSMGILAEFLGSKMPGGVITEEEVADVVRLFPRDGFKDSLVKHMCGICEKKPETTYDNFLADFGVHFVAGYDRVGHRPFDFMMNMSF